MFNIKIVFNVSSKIISYSLGKTKCMSKTGDCVVKHGTNFTTGFGMVVSVLF